MKQKNLAMLGVAVGCGLVAAIAVAKLSAGGSRGPETVKVLVAKKDLPLQTKLEEKELDNQLIWADMPKNLVPPDAATEMEQVKDKTLNRTLKIGNPVSITDLGEQNVLVIPDGFKAFTVKATPVDAAGGFAKPGAKVDIMFVERTSTGKARAAVILKDMLVLAINTVDKLTEKSGTAMAQVESVTMAVTDKQATLLALADERGKLKLVLREKGKPAGTKPSTGDDIEWTVDPFDASKAAPVVEQVAPPKMDSIVVAKKAVPMNTLLNADNVNEYFAVLEVKSAPQGVYTNVDDLKGKFAVKAIDEGTTLFKTLTGDKSVEVAKTMDPMTTPKPSPMPTVAVEKKTFPRFEQIIQEGGHAKKVIWLEVAQDKWKKFDTEKDADEYKPAPDATKADESKGTGE